MLLFRKAETRDLRAVVELLTADAVAGPRGVDFGIFEKMFAEILEDKNQLLAVAERNDAVIGCLQITVIPGLSRGATRRGQIEGMRIASGLRGRGHGSAFVVWAIGECRARACTLVQLTTDRQRSGPLQFYERLGFRNSHYGLKLEI